MTELRPDRMGNLHGEQFGTGYAGNVWNILYLSPTIMTCQGGGREPMIIVKEINTNDRKS